MGASRNEAVWFVILTAISCLPDRYSCHIQSPLINLDQTIVWKKFLMVECRMHAIHWGKQQNFAVFFFMVFFLSAHGVKGSRDIEAQFAYILAVLAVQAYTLISHCMLKSLSGCYFLSEDTYYLTIVRLVPSLDLVTELRLHFLMNEAMCCRTGYLRCFILSFCICHCVW